MVQILELQFSVCIDTILKIKKNLDSGKTVGVA